MGDKVNCWISNLKRGFLAIIEAVAWYDYESQILHCLTTAIYGD